MLIKILLFCFLIETVLGQDREKRDYILGPMGAVLHRPSYFRRDRRCHARHRCHRGGWLGNYFNNDDGNDNDNSQGDNDGNDQSSTSSCECGRSYVSQKKRDLDVADRVVYGKDAKVGEFPFMVFIATEVQRNVAALCGGSLISTLYVLTAAHCVKNRKGTASPDSINGWIGTIENPLQFSTSDMNMVEFSSVTPHPDYKPEEYHDDICILGLATPAVLGPNVGVVCLAKAGEDFTNKRAIVVGWGETSRTGGDVSGILKLAQVPVTSQTVCSDEWGDQVINAGVLCAGGKGPDSCGGDSGGPLLVNSNGRAKQIGIVSYGVEECGTKGVPSVYTCVSCYEKFIQSNTEDSPPCFQ